MHLFWQVMHNLLLLGNGNLYKLKIINWWVKYKYQQMIFYTNKNTNKKLRK